MIIPLLFFSLHIVSLYYVFHRVLFDLLGICVISWFFTICSLIPTFGHFLPLSFLKIFIVCSVIPFIWVLSPSLSSKSSLSILLSLLFGSFISSSSSNHCLYSYSSVLSACLSQNLRWLYFQPNHFCHFFPLDPSLRCTVSHRGWKYPARYLAVLFSSRMGILLCKCNDCHSTENKKTLF